MTVRVVHALVQLLIKTGRRRHRFYNVKLDKRTSPHGSHSVDTEPRTRYICTSALEKNKCAWPRIMRTWHRCAFFHTHIVSVDTQTNPQLYDSTRFWVSVSRMKGSIATWHEQTKQVFLNRLVFCARLCWAKFCQRARGGARGEFFV